MSEPAAPTGLIATAVSTTQINLSWTAPSGGNGTITGYAVLRGTAPGSVNTLVGNRLQQGTTSCSDTGLTAATTYYYYVEAVNGSGSSVASNEANALTIPAARNGPDRRAGFRLHCDQLDLDGPQRHGQRLQHLPQSPPAAGKTTAVLRLTAARRGIAPAIATPPPAATRPIITPSKRLTPRAAAQPPVRSTP